MADFSFDIVSEYDKAEVINAFDQTVREMANRYDFKDTSAQLEWLDSDKNGLKLTGDSQYQLDAILDIFRKKLAARGQSQRILNVSAEPQTSNLKTTWAVTFQKGFDHQKSKRLTALIRDSGLKVKTHIQGDSVRVNSSKKDELQAVRSLVQKHDFDFPVSFTNYR